ncbi:pyridoxamine 5'-phosphate oxidase [Haloactinopolyspora alba]|uniref:Pyridoxamine 5'-phosphate oxidase n=1 Tax=Haloactinopolyspora alba TaxID=648780 RepID=A0A2P8DVQ7_9ACTN|nr:pyridoxamine 5'-phosphate oxidase family protein [Haloactinopolyspora alba]PSL01299.1 pyridoxamine 5'-phosphate oxidase [Haloactinopolyspora alba]
MPETEPTAELLFSAADATPMSTDEATIKPWAQARDELAAAPKAWLSTSRADGRPHVMPVLAVWSDGAVHVSTRPGSIKGQNLVRDPRCVVTVGTEVIDLVVEGKARRLGGRELDPVIAAFDAKYGWRMAVRDGRLYDETLPGAPEYVFFAISPTTAFGYGPDGLTATRWRF